MTILYTNADQLTSSKKTELQHHIRTIQPHLVAICEVKLKRALEREIQDYVIPGYNLHHTNLESSKNGRGIAIFVHESVGKAVIQINSDISFEEMCLLEIKLQRGDVLLFGCIYRSPTQSSTSLLNNKKLNSFLRNIPSKKYSHICILGDFNFKDINWKTWTTQHSEESKEAHFIEALRDSFLHQNIQEPTRRRGSDDPSTIDLLLTNDEF